MFRVKICGLTSASDAQMAIEAGADAIGLNFYPQSKRYVSPAAAREIATAVGSNAVKVGVFVNATVEEIRRIVEGEKVGLDAIQLHGDEPPDFVAELAKAIPLPIVRAFRFGPDGGRPIVRYLEECARQGCTPRMILIDADRPGTYGGTGTTADWTAVGKLDREDLPPLILAGGLIPENVVDAIRTAKPVAVDVAGGVESGPGRKDPKLVRAFVGTVKAAFEGQEAKGEGRRKKDEGRRAKRGAGGGGRE